MRASALCERPDNLAKQSLARYIERDCFAQVRLAMTVRLEIGPPSPHSPGRPIPQTGHSSGRPQAQVASYLTPYSAAGPPSGPLLMTRLLFHQEMCPGAVGFLAMTTCLRFRTTKAPRTRRFSLQGRCSGIESMSNNPLRPACLCGSHPKTSISKLMDGLSDSKLKQKADGRSFGLQTPSASCFSELGGKRVEIYSKIKYTHLVRIVHSHNSAWGQETKGFASSAEAPGRIIFSLLSTVPIKR